MSTTLQDRRQQALMLSLRQRYQAARACGDAETKRALFREAVYLGIQPNQLEELQTTAAAGSGGGR